MKTSITIALGFMLSFASVFAAPLKERAIETVTICETTTEVVEVTSTVWDSGFPGAPTPAGAPDHESVRQHHGYETPSVTTSEVTVETSISSSITSPSTSSTLPSSSFESSTETTSSHSTYSSPSAQPTFPTSTPTPTPTPSPAELTPTTSSAVETPTTSSAPIPPLSIETTTPVVPPTTVVPTPTPAVTTSAAQKSVENTPASGVTFTGDATYYDVGMGSCGQSSLPGDYIVAASYLYMGSSPGGNPNKNLHCGEKVRCQLARGGPQIDVTLVDTCQGCAEQDLDFSTGAFKALGCTESEGRCKLNCYKLL